MCLKDFSPIRSMAAIAKWPAGRMIGVNGIRYDYRDWVSRHNERYPLSAGQYRRTRRLVPPQILSVGYVPQAAGKGRRDYRSRLGPAPIMAYELAEAGLDQPDRDRARAVAQYGHRLSAGLYAADELRYRIRHELFLRPEQTNFTFRNKIRPDRAADPFLGALSVPPNGVGGGGVHWNARKPGDSCLPTLVASPPI